MNIVCRDCGYTKGESQYCCNCNCNTESIDTDSIEYSSGNCDNCGSKISLKTGMFYGFEDGRVACSIGCAQELIASSCEPVDSKLKSNNEGGENDYYKFFDGCVDVDDVAQKHGMTFAEGNILKALVGIVNERNGKGTRHDADSTERACNKIIHYANKIKGEL